MTLWTCPGPNGKKVLAALLETGLAFETEWVGARDGSTRRPDDLARVPRGRIPAIHDPGGPGGQPIPSGGSGAILWWLAVKTGRLLPADPRARIEALQGVMWQVSGQGPAFGRLCPRSKGDGRGKGGSPPSRASRGGCAAVAGRAGGAGSRGGRGLLDRGPGDLALRPHAVGGADPRLSPEQFATLACWYAACTGRAVSAAAHRVFGAFLEAGSRA